LAYSVSTSFNAILNNFLEKRFGYDRVNAGYLSALPWVICSTISPIIAIFVDKYGYRASWLIFAFFCGSLG